MAPGPQVGVLVSPPLTPLPAAFSTLIEAHGACLTPAVALSAPAHPPASDRLLFLRYARVTSCPRCDTAGSRRAPCPHVDAQMSSGCVSCVGPICVRVCQHRVICELPLPGLSQTYAPATPGLTCGCFASSCLSHAPPPAWSPSAPGPSHLPKPFLQPSQPPGENLPNLQEPNQRSPPQGSQSFPGPLAVPSLLPRVSSHRLRTCRVPVGSRGPPSFSCLGPLLPLSLAPCLAHRRH